MASRQFILVAVLIPAIAFATNGTNGTTSTAWNAANVAATLLAQKAALGPQILLASGNSSSLLAGFIIGDLTSVASGPQIDGILKFTLTDVTAALAHKDFWRWIAKAIAAIVGVPASQVQVSNGGRRLVEQLRRLAGVVAAKYTIFNPNRARNIALGVGLALGVPMAVGAGVAIGMTRPEQSSPAPSTPAVTAAPVVFTTEAPESASSMPLWAGILLALALLAIIGAAIMFMQKKDKKKRAVKKAAPVREEVRVIEEVVPMLAPAPVQYIQTAAPPMTYQTVQAAPQVMYAPRQF